MRIYLFETKLCQKIKRVIALRIYIYSFDVLFFYRIKCKREIYEEKKNERKMLKWAFVVSGGECGKMIFGMRFMESWNIIICNMNVKSPFTPFSISLSLASFCSFPSESLFKRFSFGSKIPSYGFFFGAIVAI